MKNLVVAASTLSLLLTMVPQASALTISSDSFSLTEPTSENIYLMGGSLSIEAPVTGDIVAFAGDVLIKAPVTGDLLIAGGKVQIESPIDGDVRVASSQLAITNSHITGDVVYAGAHMSMDALSSSSGTIMASAMQVVLQNTSSGLVDVTATDVSFGGTHEGPVNIWSQQLRFLGGATVVGNLSYQADEVKDSGAVTAGVLDVVEKDDTVTNWYEIAQSALQVTLFAFFAILLLTFGVVRSTPEWSMEVTDRMKKKGLTSVFIGIFLLLSFPSTIGFILGLQVVFAPYAIVLLPLILCISVAGVLLLLISPAIVAFYFGRFFPLYKGAKIPLYGMIPIGSFLLALLVSLPYVGLFLTAWFMSLALGAMVQTKTRFLGVFEKRDKESIGE